MFDMISPLEKPNEDWRDEIWTHNGVPDLIFRHPDEGEDVVHLGELLEEDGEAVPLTDDRDAEVNNKGSVSPDFYSRPTYVRSPLEMKYKMWHRSRVLSYLLTSSSIRPFHVSFSCNLPKSSTISRL